MGVASRWRDCEIKDRDGNLLVSARGRAWRLGQSRSGPAGQVYDYQGVIDIQAAAALVNHRNRLLCIGDETWRVVDAIADPVLSYIELRLLQVRADG